MLNYPSGLTPGEDEIEPADPELYRYIFEHHPQPAWIYDSETLRFLAVNRAAIEEYKYSEDEFLGMPITAIRTEDDAKVLLEFLDGPVGSKVTGPWRHRRKDGSFLVVSVHSHDLIYRGRPARLLVVTDLSERRRMEQDLRLLAAAVGSASEAVMITTAAWGGSGPGIVFVNSAFMLMTGYTEAEAIGQSPSILQGPKSERISRDRIRRDLEQHGSATYESVNYRKNGEQYVAEWQVTPLRDEAGAVTHYLSLQKDVTERNRLQAQLQQSQKMEAVGRLAGGIAHDFNNLLTIILGYAGLLSIELSQQSSAGERELRSLMEIQKAAEKAAELTGQLLAFSRKQILKTRVLSLGPVIANIERMLRRLIGEDIDLDLKLDSEPACVEADPGHIEQILLNLSVNARDAMPRGGMLTIEMRNVEVSLGGMPGTPAGPGPYVLIEVTDTGHGMDEETRQRVFEPFFTTKEAGHGTGLGLSIVYGLVKQSGGHIAIYSEEGNGTCVKIYLPRTGSPPEDKPRAQVSALPRGSGSILIVEDDASIRDLVTEMLSGAGYEVLAAGNADQAVQLASSHPNPLDLLMTDVVLPGTSGPDLAERLKEIQPDLRVLFASGYSDHALLRQGSLQNDAAFIQKPFDTSSLLRAIGALLQPAASQTGSV